MPLIMGFYMMLRIVYELLEAWQLGFKIIQEDCCKGLVFVLSSALIMCVEECID